MNKQNCWEFKNCGREPNGSKIEEYGVCPAALETNTNEMNGGTNGGRCCWAISGTLCGGDVQGSYAVKYGNCLLCNFYEQVIEDEKENLKNTDQVRKAIDVKKDKA